VEFKGSTNTASARLVQLPDRVMFHEPSEVYPLQLPLLFSGETASPSRVLTNQCPRWKRSQTEFCGKTSFEGILKDFAGDVLNERRGAAGNYQTGSRNPRPSNPLAVQRRYSAYAASARFPREIDFCSLAVL
jgi:hypothetical protein